MKKNKPIGVLMSGGLDSAALTAHYLNANRTVWPVYVQCGLRWEKAELFWLQKFLRAVRRPNLKPLSIVAANLHSAYDGNWSRRGTTPSARSHDRAVYLPARNLLLILNAALELNRIGIREFALGPLKGNPFRDGRKPFFKKTAAVLSESFGTKITIHVPFRDMTKADVVRRYRSWPLQLVFSCLRPTGVRPCGACNKCAELSKALRAPA